MQGSRDAVVRGLKSRDGTRLSLGEWQQHDHDQRQEASYERILHHQTGIRRGLAPPNSVLRININQLISLYQLPRSRPKNQQQTTAHTSPQLHTSFSKSIKMLGFTAAIAVVAALAGQASAQSCNTGQKYCGATLLNGRSMPLRANLLILYLVFLFRYQEVYTYLR